jgi:hypothetical protein
MSYRTDLHDAGVHAECSNSGTKTAPRERRCKLAGKVERFHSHEFDGPLVCGCEDLANPI